MYMRCSYIGRKIRRSTHVTNLSHFLHHSKVVPSQQRHTHTHIHTSTHIHRTYAHMRNKETYLG